MNRSCSPLRIRRIGSMFMMLLPFAVTVQAQLPDSVTLFECQVSAMESYPLHEQKALYRQTRELNVKNHTVNWYPSLNLNGKYTWQNEVVEIPFPETLTGFEIPVMPHSTYKLSLDIQQTLYDGGLTHSGKQLEDKLLEVNNQQVEVGLNRLKERVNAFYFYLLVLQEQEKTMQLKNDEIQDRMNVMESRLKNEIILASDLNVLKAEKLNVEQQLAELRISRESVLAALKELTQMNLTASTVLVLPTEEASLPVEPGSESLPPEKILYDLQISKLDASIRMTDRQRYPKAFVFGQFGYGNPALNFFRDEFRGYYIVGAGLQWQIWDWNLTRRKKQVLAVQQDIIRSEKEAFSRDLDIRLEEMMSSIVKCEEAVDRDYEILKLREEITRTAVSRLENGVITSSDYITELDKEIQARIQLDLHRIQLQQARINYLTGKGLM